MATEKPPAVLGLPVVILILGILLAAPTEDPVDCSACAGIPPFVATRTELLIYDPPPPLPSGPRD